VVYGVTRLSESMCSCYLLGSADHRSGDGVHLFPILKLYFASNHRRAREEIEKVIIAMIVDGWQASLL